MTIIDIKINILELSKYDKKDFIISIFPSFYLSLFIAKNFFNSPINLPKRISRFVTRRRILSQEFQDEDTDRASKDVASEKVAVDVKSSLHEISFIFIKSI